MTTSKSLIALTEAFLDDWISSPTAPPNLQQTRVAVPAAESDPAVVEYAPLEPKKATESLKNANDLSARREPVGQVSSAAIVAADAHAHPRGIPPGVVR